jgi:hypothetical protein
MKTFILILSLVLLTNLDLSYSKEIKSFKDAKTIDEYRYINFMLCGKDGIIRNDNDRYVNGVRFIESKKESLYDNYKKKIKKEKQNNKYKSTYLDFVILNEENIS